MKKIALITGITGQDGSYLAEFLLRKNYLVHGIKRKSSQFNTQLIDNIYEDPLIKNKKFFLHYGDMTDSLTITKIIKKVKPNEIYNLAAQSHVAVSFDNPEFISNVNAFGALRILESIKLLGLEKYTKFYQASTSEMFGDAQKKSLNEKSSFQPKSPYGVSKLYAYWMTKVYRESYKIYAVNGILFNHESERRGETFVTRKITKGLSEILCGKRKCLFIGNLDSKRDWGHAKDYVRAMWLMLQKKKPEDFVISTGIQHTVEDFAKLAFKEIDLNYKKYLIIDKKLYRPSEVDSLLGNCGKAKRLLKWKPEYNFKKLVKDMVKEDIEFVENEGY